MGLLILSLRKTVEHTIRCARYLLRKHYKTFLKSPIYPFTTIRQIAGVEIQDVEAVLLIVSIPTPHRRLGGLLELVVLSIPTFCKADMTQQKHCAPQLLALTASGRSIDDALFRRFWLASIHATHTMPNQSASTSCGAYHHVQRKPVFYGKTYATAPMEGTAWTFINMTKIWNASNTPPSIPLPSPPVKKNVAKAIAALPPAEKLNPIAIRKLLFGRSDCPPDDVSLQAMQCNSSTMPIAHTGNVKITWWISTPRTIKAPLQIHKI